MKNKIEVMSRQAIEELIESGIEIFADYRYYPNQLVFNKLLFELRES